MTTPRRFLILLLGALMVTCLLPSVAFAAKNVTEVTITDVGKPVAGVSASYEYTLEEERGIEKFRNSEGYTSRWVETDTMPQSWADIGAGRSFVGGDFTFKAGKYYTFIALVEAKSNYTFTDDVRNHVLTATATINGQHAGITRLSDRVVSVYHSFYVSDESSSTQIILTIGERAYEVNGEPRISDSAPVIVSDRTFVPFRLVAEALGAEVAWDGVSRTATTSLDDITVWMQIGSLGVRAYIADKGLADGVMDVAPYINKANRTMVPLRFVVESLGCTITPEYAEDGTTKRVVIEKQ